jgi:hypothetical protein
VQSEAPASANFPASQSEQALADVENKDSEYLPSGQAVQVVDELALEYLPAVQEAHVANELAPAALEYLPAVQETHVADELAPVRGSRSNTAIRYDPDTSTAHAHHRTHVTYAAWHYVSVSVFVKGWVCLFWPSSPLSAS